MSMIILGLAAAVGHDPAAALFVDGQLVAAVEEERFVRRKHAKGELPYLAARQCLRQANLRASDVTHVAIPYAPTSLLGKARWHYAYRHWYAPDRSIDTLFNGNRRFRRYLGQLRSLLEKLHIDYDRVELRPVNHLLAHASSAYHLQETDARIAIFCNDFQNEYTNMFFGYGLAGNIALIKEFHNPDSLCGMYAALTDYLGFDYLDGEFKVMGLAPFGDPKKYDLSDLAHFDGKRFRVNNKLITTVGLRRFKEKSKGHYFSRELVEKLGPRRAGKLLEDPYVHYAAAVQKLYEDIAVAMVERYLGAVIEESGRLAVAGTGSMNIRLNQRLAALPAVKELIVHPACGDAGTAIGAAAYVARSAGSRLQPVPHMYLGPAYSSDDCIEACASHRDKPQWELLDDPHGKAAELLANGQLVAWFRGAMEFGPRALGHRSILANPAQTGIADMINRQVKYRERWRPFSPSVLDTEAETFFAGRPQDEFMCISTPVSQAWQEQYPALSDRDGSTRAQVVKQEHSPDFHRLLCSFKEKTGHGMLINTSLCRPGEALVCSPGDAVEMFMGTDLDYLILENLLVTKRAETDTW